MHKLDTLMFWDPCKESASLKVLECQTNVRIHVFLLQNQQLLHKQAEYGTACLLLVSLMVSNLNDALVHRSYDVAFLVPSCNVT